MSVTRQYREVLVLLLAMTVFAVFAIPGASALNTHLNITLSETVNQNVTFARDFLLEENRTYSLIEGVVTVINPGTEEVYDTYLRLINIESLSSDFQYVSGRNGYQVVYPDTTANVTTYPTNHIINNTEYYDLGVDLDEDGTNDLVTINDTHIIFNITSEYELRAYNFYNGSNTSMDISITPSPLDMLFNITSLREDLEYNDGVDFAEVQINGTVTDASVLNLTQVTLTINDSARNYAILHIPELRSGQQTVYHYNVSSTLVDPPLDIDTAYTNPEFETKVLSGEYFWVRLTASNVATVGALENVNITLQAESVSVTNDSVTEVFDFTLHNLSNDTSISDDYTNVDNSSNRTWYWNTNAGTIAIGESHNISFQIRAPDTVNSSGTFLALTQTLAYQINTTGSTLSVSEVRARSEINFNTTKRIVAPQDNLSNNNVTWESRPNVGTTQNITYDLEKVTLWVTDVLDPNQLVYNLTTDYLPGTTINLTTDWTGSAWFFNFTDGSSDVNPPPIVWVKPYWIIRNTENQIINSSITVNGTDLYMNYIYVVNGYWLEVQKQVLDAGDDQFNIRIEVSNRGNGHTPQNLTVTVYDFIPSEFTAWNFTPTFDNSSNVSGEFSGVAYQWDVGLRTNISTSFAPRGDPLGNDMFWVNYTVNGTGDFAVSDLYIVGLDPRALDGAVNPFEGVAVFSSIATTSREVLYLAIVVFLIGINVANFFMTSKINRKLDKK